MSAASHYREHHEYIPGPVIYTTVQACFAATGFAATPRTPNQTEAVNATVLPRDALMQKLPTALSQHQRWNNKKHPTPYAKLLGINRLKASRGSVSGSIHTIQQQSKRAGCEADKLPQSYLLPANTPIVRTRAPKSVRQTAT